MVMGDVRSEQTWDPFWREGQDGGPVGKSLV